MNQFEAIVSTTIFSDTTWLTPAYLEQKQSVDTQLFDWLTEPGSLTRRLQQHARQFNVEVLRHDESYVSSDEQQFMQHQAGQRPQCREVLLRDGDRAWVFARSIIPSASHQLLDALHNIGDNPLGEALFVHPEIQPSAFEFAQFAPNSKIAMLNHQHTGVHREIWGRRRIFWIQQHPVLVAEVFLSTAPCYNLDIPNE